MVRKEFTAQLEAVGPNGAWTFMTVPFNVAEVFGSKARVAVVGTINGFPFRSSLMPNGDGTHSMMVNKELQKGARAVAGETVAVVMEPDTAPRTVEVPADLTSALCGRPEAEAIFEKLSYSHKKAFIDWIEGAKRAETRTGRVEKTLEMLVEGKRLNM
jgi:uncharacterized protein DUF1905/bacteriocin resistance YdeI/OmpD-like protein